MSIASRTNGIRKKRSGRQRLPEWVIALVWARAAGRCEFCNEPVWKDALTTKQVNAGKLAHIVAASPDGPRGDAVDSPRLAKDPSNIMLLCGSHHDLVDKKEHEASYPVEDLRSKKRRHHERIERLTHIAEHRKSVALSVQIPVGTYTTEIRRSDTDLALTSEGLYPDDSRSIHIDLNGMLSRDHDSRFWQDARDALTAQLDQGLKAAKHKERIEHLSVVGFGPMALMMLLGYLLDEKGDCSVYNLHRVPKGWRWPADVRRITKLLVRAPAQETRSREVALILSLTSRVQEDSVRSMLPAGTPIYGIDWDDPQLDCLRFPDELARFAHHTREVMESIHRVGATRVHVFPAVPVAAAVEFGRALQKKLHPPMELYDYHAGGGGWRRVLTLDATPQGVVT